MKRILVLTAAFFLLAACHQSPCTDCSEVERGKVLIEDSLLVDIPLPQFPDGMPFRFQLTAGGKKGTYSIICFYRNDTAHAWLVMPAGGEKYCPVSRKDTVSRFFTIGFCVGSDTTFYPYFRIAPEKDRIDMKYLAVYSFPKAD